MTTKYLYGIVGFAVFVGFSSDALAAKDTSDPGPGIGAETGVNRPDRVDLPDNKPVANVAINWWGVGVGVVREMMPSTVNTPGPGDTVYDRHGNPVGRAPGIPGGAGRTRQSGGISESSGNVNGTPGHDWDVEGHVHEKPDTGTITEHPDGRVTIEAPAVELPSMGKGAAGMRMASSSSGRGRTPVRRELLRSGYRKGAKFHVEPETPYLFCDRSKCCEDTRGPRPECCAMVHCVYPPHPLLKVAPARHHLEKVRAGSHRFNGGVGKVYRIRRVRR